MFGGRELSEGDSEVIGIVKSIKEILVCALVSRGKQSVGDRTDGKDVCLAVEEIPQGWQTASRKRSPA